MDYDKALSIARGWIAGLLTFVSVKISTLYILRLIGLKFDDDDSFVYVAGGVFAACIGYIAGMFAFEKRWKDVFSQVEEKYQLCAMILGAGIFMVLAGIIETAFYRKSMYWSFFFELLTFAGVTWSCNQWYKNRLARYKQIEHERFQARLKASSPAPDIESSMPSYKSASCYTRNGQPDAQDSIEPKPSQNSISALHCCDLCAHYFDKHDRNACPKCGQSVARPF